MSFYDPQVETLDAQNLRDLQNEKLRSLMNEIPSSEFYNERFRAAGIEWNRVERFEDLRDLPFTTKTELVEEQAARPPFGRLLTRPMAEYLYFHQTSGTTGRPLRWLDTLETWNWFVSSWGYVYRAAGVTENDVVFCAFSFGPYISHWTAISGAWHVGAMCVSGGGMNSEQRLQAIVDNQCSVIVSTPTYALHLAEVAARVGIDLRASAIRKGIHAGEPGASLPNVRGAIEQAWGMKVFDHAGATEVGAWAFDCGMEVGAIHLNEAEFIFEVIDPSSGELVSEGKRGELVITNLGRAAMPVIRYRTGDLVEMTREPCSCGRRFARIRGGVLGRADDMMIVRGVNLYPGAIDNIIRGVAGVVEYEVNLRSVAGMDDLLIKFESDEQVSADEISRSLLHAFRNQFNIRVSLEQAATGSLPRYEFKARRYKRQ